MKRLAFVQWLAAMLAVTGFCCPQSLLAATPSHTPAPMVTDVTLQEGGVLMGQVVTPENTAVAGTDVSLRSGDQLLATSRTNEQGYFAFTGLRNGVYQVTTASGYGACRAWTAGLAPPAAQQGVLIVEGKEAFRGQCAEECGGGCGGGCGGMGGAQCFRNFFANPLVIAGLVATAIAVPVAIHNSHHHAASP